MGTQGLETGSQEAGYRIPAFWCACLPSGETSAYVRLFTSSDGAIAAKAPGLQKPGSKLAPWLQYGDELLINLAPGRGRAPILTGVALSRSHAYWREDLKRLSLLWFMLECAWVTSAAPRANSDTFQLIANLLRSNPQASALPAALCVFCLKLLAMHGLLPDLLSCAESGAAFKPGEPVFLLPTGEGLISRDSYNERYARSSANLRRIEAGRRERWSLLLHGALLRYPERGCDLVDAVLLLDLASLQLGSLANQEVASAKQLRQAWQLPAPDA